MCNLYSMTRSRDEVARLFRVSHNRAAAFEPLRAIFPGHIAPVVRRAADGGRELSLLSWGCVRLQPGRAPKRVTNVRDDDVASPFWRDPPCPLRKALAGRSDFLRIFARSRSRRCRGRAASDSRFARPHPVQ